MALVRVAAGLAAFGLGLAILINPVAAQSGHASPAAESAEALSAEATRLYNAEKYAEAVPFAQRALAVHEKAVGPDHPSVGTLVNNLAVLYQEQGRYSEAEPLYNRSLAIREKALGPDHPIVANSLNHLALMYLRQARYSEAEPLLKRSLAIREKALGLDHFDVGTSLDNLAELYRAQGRYSEVEPLLKRSLAIREKVLGLDHFEVSTSLNNLAALYRVQGRYSEAEPLYKRSLVIREKTAGPDHPVVATSLNNLAELYFTEGRYAEAEPLHKRSLAIAEKALGSDHPDVASSLNNLAALYRAQNRYSEAEPLYKRSLAILEKALGADHPAVTQSLDNLAWLALAQQNWARAAEHWHRSTTILQNRTQRGLGGAFQGLMKGEAQRNSWSFKGLVKVTHRLASEDRSRGNQPDGMFETAQWALDSEAASSLAQMALRSASGSPALSALVRERQDLVAEWQAKDKQLIAAKSAPPARRNAEAEQSLSSRLSAIDTRLGAIDARLTKDFRDYAALSSPKPISVADVQANLRPNEALVLFLDTDARFKPLPEETFVWVVTKTDVKWVRSGLGTAALAREVATLRCGFDASAWTADRSQCSTLTSVTYTDADHTAGKPLPFDVALAHTLYKGLFSGVEGAIKGKHLLIVPSGALTTLPFQVLVIEPPTSTDLKSAHWLIRDHAITVLPSAASLAALRRTAKPVTATKPMIGFGNPLLDGDQRDPQLGAYYKGQAQIARAQTGCAASSVQRTAALRTRTRSAAALPQLAGLVDIADLRGQTPLPETADELCTVARSVGADVGELRIGARATETEIKRLSENGALAQYRIVHFATHGVLAGELTGASEPGLVLTPPQTATAEDDGYLSGSEIATLKLDADWVVLSACNTAGGAGIGEAAEALSGLARVFFYAGARALLVSHWAVDSAATVTLITTAIAALATDKALGRAEALRRAMLAVMNDSTRPANWVPAYHPSVWAPFVVVGEGGAGR